MYMHPGGGDGPPRAGRAEVNARMASLGRRLALMGCACGPRTWRWSSSPLSQARTMPCAVITSSMKVSRMQIASERVDLRGRQRMNSCLDPDTIGTVTRRQGAKGGKSDTSDANRTSTSNTI